MLLKQTEKEKAFDSLSEYAQLKMNLDSAKTLEQKLFYCLLAHFLPGIRYFLQKGADLNLPVYGGAAGTAIHFATDQPKAVLLLLAYGAKQNAQDLFGWTIASD